MKINEDQQATSTSGLTSANEPNKIAINPLSTVIYHVFSGNSAISSSSFNFSSTIVSGNNPATFAYYDKIIR
jgi:hypothetical protein